MGPRKHEIENGSCGLYYENPSFKSSSSDIQQEKKFLGSNDFIVVDTTTKSQPTALEDIKSAGLWIRKKAKRACSRKTIKKKLPILAWLPKYDASCAVGDLVAGITVGLTLIPQGLAFSSIVGVPTQYGLYSSFVGCFVYIIFGSCKDVAIGPTAIQSLLAFQAAGELGLEHVILLSFLTGLVQLLMSVFCLGFLVDFISGPVSSGFTSASALIVVASLMKDILGVSGSGTTFVSNCAGIFRNIHETRLGDAVVGTSCIVFLLVMKSLCSLRVGSSEDTEKKSYHQAINTLLWLMSISRNAFLVLLCGVIGYKYCLEGTPPFKVIGDVPAGLPGIKVPPFGYSEVRNGTVIEHGLVDMVKSIGSGVFVVAIVGLLEDIAVCKTFGKGQSVDATQELLAIGLCNLANSFVQAFPITGALARSAVNHSSGVKTTLGGLYSGVLVMASLLIFTPYFYYIPKATLSAVIIAAVLVMIEVKVVRPMWNSKKSDFMLWFITFVACLVFPLEIGVLIGVGINLTLILYHSARPKITIEKLKTSSGIEFLLLTPDRCLIFPSADYVRKVVRKNSLCQGVPVVMDCSHVYGVDYTAATVILSLTQDFAAECQLLLFYNLRPSVNAVLRSLGPEKFVAFYDGNEIDELLRSRLCAKKEQEMLEA